MKLLVVNVFFDPNSFGGATVVCEHLAEALDRSFDVEVTVVSGRFEELPTLSVVRHTTKYGFEAFNIGVPTNISFEQGYKNTDFASEIRRIMRYVEPDIVHVHCVQNIGAEFISVVCESNTPLIVTVHDCWWLCERQFMLNGHGVYCGQQAIDRSVCAACVGNRQRVDLRLDYLLSQLAKANLILTPSAFARSLLVANGLSPRKVLISGNGIIEPAPRSEMPARDTDKTIFGYVGGPGFLKGWELIVEAARSLPRDSFELHVVDAADRIGRSWRKDFEAYSDILPIKILPSYTSHEIDEVFSGFDVLLMPSLWKETFGLTAREALLRDVWVVASDAGGLAENIRNGDNGSILPFPPTAQELRSAMQDRLGKPKVVLPGKEEVVRVEGQARQLFDLMNELLGRKAHTETAFVGAELELP